MEEKKGNAPASVLKPFVNGGVAGLLSGCLNGFIDYSMSSLHDARYRKHPNYVLYCFNRNWIPGMVLVDAFAFSQILGFYNILRGEVVDRNDGMRPSLYQEAASGLIAGTAAAYLRFPFDLVNQHKTAVSMGPIADRWRISSQYSVSHILREGGPWLKTKAGLGMGMVAAYNPSLHYLIESHGFSEKDAKSGARAISAFSAAACAQLAIHAGSFSSKVSSKNSQPSIEA
ncbi:mitochondrial dicarboxylate/tricarboxylate transporter DTC-like [Argentina anserina]|uniref:mitochondrial dicarboxylate/tricarboxylate transporter DTC-like n=1 Tax=Argentina anserina TaxID=57926 RepID=UPI00217685B2|nr:mitochondrial dicarboxylate/tricarboxylate transporter DTC-like [Potentilla anserina]